jgi:serine phosphatase RsbU (regulator of sigma subunit)
MTSSIDDLSQCKILLVDDVKSNITILIETLKEDYKLGFALNGPDALAFAKAKSPDLILLDIMMPGMDGYEVCRRLKNDPATRGIPILFITALDEIANKTEAFEAGAVDYITKPFEVLEVKARVKTHLTLKMAQQLIESQRDRLQQSLDLAKEVQLSLLPESEPDLPGIDIAGRSVYCDETGGDYYDFLEMDDHRLGILVGDVSGHGIQSALLMTTVRGSLRQRILAPGNLSRIVSDLNLQFQKDVKYSGNFMTLFISEFDMEKRTLHWVRAGHDPAFLYDIETDTFDELGGPGLALGVAEDFTYQDFSRTIQKNQILIIGTDGIWESETSKGVRFGKKRFQDIIRKHARDSARRITDAVIEAVQRFSHPLKYEDDITLATVKFEE